MLEKYIFAFFVLISVAFSADSFCEKHEHALVVLSMNCCVEGFNDDNFLHRTNQFADFIRPHIAGTPFIIGLQEVKPFEDRDFDLSFAIYQKLQETDETCSHFLCAHVFDEGHPSVLNDTAIITNLKHLGNGVCVLPNGQNISVTSVHLTDTPYQLSQIIGEDYDGTPLILGEKGGKSVAKQVVESAYPRSQDLGVFLERSFNNKKGTALLVGDFNEPSHEDWVPGALDMDLYGSFSHVPHAIEWPCTKTLVDKYGFIDALRALHPDPTRVRGYTYPSSAPIPTFGPKTRIDHIFVRNGRPTHIEIMDTELSDHKFVKACLRF
jgi:hypothetical protein